MPRLLSNSVFISEGQQGGALYKNGRKIWPVVVRDSVEVLREPFNNFTMAPWPTVTGTCTIQPGGRTGSMMQGTSSGSAAYDIPVAKQSKTMLVGFAFKISALAFSTQQFFAFKNPTNADALRLTTNSSGAITPNMGTAAPNGTLVANTWQYIEIKYTIDNIAGSLEVRVDGVPKITFSGDTNLGLAEGVLIGKVHLVALNGGNTWFDDLYLLSGSESQFQGSQIIT